MQIILYSKPWILETMFSKSMTSTRKLLDWSILNLADFFEL